MSSDGDALDSPGRIADSRFLDYSGVDHEIVEGGFSMVRRAFPLAVTAMLMESLPPTG
jgi:hypothetical protein